MKANHGWLLAPLTALLAAGCAQSTGDINRVQPGVVKKSELLDGQWYYRNTVTWTPATTGFTYPGQTGNIEKIVFEIQMGYLMGYRAYPYIVGAEPNIDPTSKPSGTTAQYCDPQGVCTGGKVYYGAPVLAFPIESHFDIQRNYNPLTGEPGNVIAENTTDRIWNQREFMRVDWSANMLNTMSGMNWGTVQNPVGGSSSSTWIQANEPGSDPYDWPTFEYDGNHKLTYMDFTGRYIANPDMYYFEGYGYYPLCYLDLQYDCSSSEIKMRISLAKVDPEKTRDYEPLVYPNDLMSKFGYFRTERLNYDRKFGYNESAVIRLANRHRIWEGYYQKGSDGAPDYARPIPFAERVVKPIAYYVTPAERMGGQKNYDEYMVPARRMEKNWDKGFRRAVGAAQGKTPEQAGQVFFICENPVPDYATQPEFANNAVGAQARQAACGKPGYSPHFGDLRKSFMYTVAEPVANGLLGYGPSSADPETGELISGTANTYLWGIDLYGRSVLDLIDLILSETPTRDFIAGDKVREYLNDNPAYAIESQRTQTVLQSELQGIPTRNEETKGAFQRPSAHSRSLISGLKSQGGLAKYGGDTMRSAADRLAKNPQLESAVLDNPEVQYDLVAMLPQPLRARAAKDADFRRAASRNVLTNISAGRSFEKQRLDFASKNNLYLAEFYDRTLVGLAFKEAKNRTTRVNELKNKPYPSCADRNSCTAKEARDIANDEISARIRQSVWQATSEHELGHTLGLRHNFEGSFDAVNYFDNYWTLRKPTLTVQQNGVSKLPRTTGDLKSAADGTVSQRAQGMYDYEYSSIMDYAGKINGDTEGVGKYDEAAIIFAYSGGTEPGYVEVFESARAADKPFPGSDGTTVTITGAAYDLPLVNAEHRHAGIRDYTERYHYSTVPLHFGEGADIDAVMSDGINKLKKRKLMKWADVKKDNDRIAALIEKGVKPTAAEVGNVPLEVPYMFCTDDHVGGVLACNRFDRGPDYYEMMRTELEDYWNYYYSTHFRRDRYNFSSGYAMNSAFNTFNAVTNIYKHWVHEFYGKAAATSENIPVYPVDPMIQDYWTMAVLDGVNAQLNVMSVPPFGLMRLRNMGPQEGLVWDSVADGDQFDMLNDEGIRRTEEYYRGLRTPATDFVILPRGEGRRMYSSYDYKSGFNFWYRMLEAGHYNDQIGAMFAAVMPYTEFLGVDSTSDTNRFNINYYTVFKKEMTDNFGSLWSSNEQVIRPLLYRRLADDGVTATDTPDVAFKRWVDGATYVDQFNYPRPEDAACVGMNTVNCIKPIQKPGRLNVQMTWTSRIYALYLGMALFSTNYDLDYAKANQVFKLGSGEAASVATGYHAVEVQDTGTGARYVAYEKDGAIPNSTPAIRLINQSREYLQVVNDPAMCPLPPFVAIYYDCMDTAEVSNPMLVEQRRKQFTALFRDQIRDLDLSRGFYAEFGRAF